MIVAHGGVPVHVEVLRALVASSRGTRPGRQPSPSGPAFTVVLLAHVGAALVSMIALVAAAVSAGRLLASRGGPVPTSVRAYFRPGTNWAGRAMVAVPVLGAVLIALSGGADGWGDDWVVAGLVLWAVAVGVGESVVWPAERRVQAALAAPPTAPPTTAPATAVDGRGASTPALAERPAGADVDAPPSEEVLAACRVLWRSATLVLGILVVAMVVMVARP